MRSSNSRGIVACMTPSRQPHAAARCRQHGAGGVHLPDLGLQPAGGQARASSRRAAADPMRDPLEPRHRSSCSASCGCAACRSGARRHACLPGLVAGVLFGVEFLLIYRGLLYTTASRAVLFIYLAPFFVVLGARWLLPGDRFGLDAMVGLLLAFVGMVVAFGVPAPASSPRPAPWRPDDGAAPRWPGPRPRW